MTPFEEQLKHALARQYPPADFTGRVLAAVENGRVQSSTPGWRRWIRWTHTWRLVPVLAALVLMSGGAVYREQQRAVRGEAAKQKLLVAMRIAGSKLQEARTRVFEIEAAETNQ